MCVTVYFIINQYLQIDKSERGCIFIVHKNYTLKKKKHVNEMITFLTDVFYILIPGSSIQTLPFFSPE